MQAKLTSLMLDLKKDEACAEALERAKSGENVMNIIDDCREGMVIVGDRFQRGESFLVELMLIGEIMKVVLETLDPYMKGTGDAKAKGTIVMATMQGDIHDLGKNITATLLKANGFEVVDLGVDVPVNTLVEKVKELKPDFIGFSSLLTVTAPVMKDAVDRLKAEGLRDSLKIIVGGGVTTPQTKEYVGADFQTLDAMETVRFCKEMCGG